MHPTYTIRVVSAAGRGGQRVGAALRAVPRNSISGGVSPRMRCCGGAVAPLSPLQHQRCAASSSSTVAATELRAALHTLGLDEDCTDAEVKRAFHAFAMEHHPDTSSATASTPAGDAAERMHRGTEAYHLLRQLPFGVRQHILREGERGAGRFRGAHDSDFEFTEEEYAKAQRVYQGDQQRRRQRQQRGDHNSNDEGEDLFDQRTAEGRRRTARLNEFQERIHHMRRMGLRDDLPPWRVDDRQQQAQHQSPSGSAKGATGSSTSSADARRADGPRNPHRLGLHFFSTSASRLREVRDLYRTRPGFAGMDGSSYDNEGSAARVAPELRANPNLRQYILMQHRAQEKAIIDRAVRRPLFLFIVLAFIAATALMLASTVRTYQTRLRKDDELRRRDDARGGA